MQKTIPNAPGIYLFKNSKNCIIYIGKAKSLKKRVSSYFQKKDTDWKIDAMLQEHAKVDFIVTKNEIEALLLEAQMIKDYQPKYNVLLKSGQPFVYILFTSAKPNKLPIIKLVRNKKTQGTYFGPFLQKMRARKAYQYLLRTFRLQLCNKTIENGCLNYHLGTCAGTCKTDFNKEDYLFRIQLAIAALKKNHKLFEKQAKEKITHYNKNFEFEKAKNVTQYLKNMKTLFTTLETKFTPDEFTENILRVTTQHYETLQKQNINFALQIFIQTDNPIRTIDCFDVSHFQSQHLVGSCIRFTDGKPDKNMFRRFKIKTLTEQNDYAALQEIVDRRYANKPEELPDAIVIDGGKGQRNAIAPLIPDTTLLLSLAKNPDRLFGPGFENGKVLDVATQAGKTLLALRDYTHHFAIQYHRLRRKKAFTKN